jgi:hypothetical protein
MSATPTADRPFVIVLDDETEVVEGRLGEMDAGPTWAKHRVTIEALEDDTSGHALESTSISIGLRFDADVETHAVLLELPTAAYADELRQRLLVRGAVAGALVVGVTAAQLAGTGDSTPGDD